MSPTVRYKIMHYSTRAHAGKQPTEILWVISRESQIYACDRRLFAKRAATAFVLLINEKAGGA